MSTKLFIVVLSACIFLQDNYATTAENSHTGVFLRNIGDLKYKGADTVERLFSAFHPDDDSDKPRHYLIGDILRAIGDSKYRAAEKADDIVETAKSYAGHAIGKIISKVQPSARSSSDRTTPKAAPKILLIYDGNTRELTKDEVIRIARRFTEARKVSKRNQ